MQIQVPPAYFFNTFTILYHFQIASTRQENHHNYILILPTDRKVEKKLHSIEEQRRIPQR